MQIHKITTPGLAVHSYLLIDSATKEAAVIDPTRDITELLNIVQSENCTVTKIFETHVPTDFISGSKELKAYFKGIPLIHCSALGGSDWIPAYCDVKVQDEEEIALGKLTIQAWRTPGSSFEHVMWVVFKGPANAQKAYAAFTGNFLFSNRVARPDLLGLENTEKLAEALYESIFSVLPQLPNSMLIYPEQGPHSTLTAERETNPYLKYMPQFEWIQNVLKDLPEVPSYFSWVKEVNLVGAPLLRELLPLFQLNAEELAISLQEGILAIDIRSKEDFAHSHAKGALNIPLEKFFAQGTLPLLPLDAPIILIGEKEECLRKALMAIRLKGFDTIKAFYLQARSSSS